MMDTLIIIGIFIGFFLLVIRPLQKKYGPCEMEKEDSTIAGCSGLSDDYLVGRRYTDEP